MHSKMPVFTVPGNHDYAWDSINYPNNDIEPYLKYIVPGFKSYTSTSVVEGDSSDYSFDYGDIHFIGLNSGQPRPLIFDMTSDGLSNDQMSWIESDYIDAGSKSTFVFMHHPIVGHNGDENVMYNRENFVNWANANKVEAVFCGHTHDNNIYYDVDDTNINNPPDYNNPVKLQTIDFSKTTRYIESINSN